MKDLVIVENNQEEEFIRTAEKLGFDEIILAYNKLNSKNIDVKKQNELKKKTKLKVEFGIIGENLTKPEGFNHKILLGTKTSSLSKDVTILLNNENEPEKDFTHQRRSGLNHVVITDLTKKNIEVYAGLNQLKGKKPWEQIRILGRMKQNIKLTKKKNTKYELVSCASTPNEMRKAKDIIALKRVLEKENFNNN